MTNRRASAVIATLFAAAACAGAASPASGARGGPLLSGYGGPGEGEQAILGSALLGGPPSPGAGQGGGGQLAAPRPAPLASGAVAGATRGSAGSSRGGTGGAARRRVSTSKSGARARPETRPVLPLTRTGSSQPLGLSNADLLYILLAVAVLAVTAGLTKQLARRSR